MQEILFGYKLNPTTWAYISALMMIGIYFKFRRFWSVRNLDLIALISFSPGLLLVYHGLLNDKDDLVRAGYVWLFAVSAFFLDPPAAGSGDGPPAAAGAEPLGQRPDVHRHLACWCS